MHFFIRGLQNVISMCTSDLEDIYKLRLLSLVIASRTPS